MMDTEIKTTVTEYQRVLPSLDLLRAFLGEEVIDKCRAHLGQLEQDVKVREHLADYKPKGPETEMYAPFSRIANRVLLRAREDHTRSSGISIGGPPISPE